jgi:L-ascorbate metabolism protein UlaG (beta-lactamase superfamily)
MDHLDFATLQQIGRAMPVVVAKNTADILDNMSFRSVHELDWGEKITLAGVDVEALQVRHFGWRFPWEDDRSKGIWNGRSYNAYLLTKNGRSIFFGGDSAMQEFFKPVGERGITVDLAMMPIGAYDPWKDVHCNPEEAIAMAGHVNAQVIMPIHWGTFIQSEEPTQEPIERFTKALADQPHRIALTKQGETWVWNEVADPVAGDVG